MENEIQEIKIENILDDEIGFVGFIDMMGNELSIVNAARVSFGKRKNIVDDNDKKLIKYLLVNRHNSPLEHITFTFNVKTPIFIARQWMRHRTQSYNEISRRYTSENIEFHIPKKLRKQSENNRQASTLEIIESNDLGIEKIKEATQKCYETYLWLLENGVCREQAREILPMNLYTEFYVTLNLWNLFHFLSLRNDGHAQLEIQQYAQAIEKILEEKIPNVYNIWKEYKDKK